MHNKMLLSHAMKVLLSSWCQLCSSQSMWAHPSLPLGYNTVHLERRPPADTDRQGDREWSRDIWIRPKSWTIFKSPVPSTWYTQLVHVLMWVSQNYYSFLSVTLLVPPQTQSSQCCQWPVILMLTKMKWTVIRLSPSHVVEGSSYQVPGCLLYSICMPLCGWIANTYSIHIYTSIAKHIYIQRTHQHSVTNFTLAMCVDTSHTKRLSLTCPSSVIPTSDNTSPVNPTIITNTATFISAILASAITCYR